MIVNLTQHQASADQVAAGVVDLPPGERARLVALLTFETPPSEAEIIDRADEIALIANAAVPEEDYQYAMIGGALWLMSPLAAALREQRIEPVFAFSVRDTEEQKQADGSVRKVSVFRHAGFVPAVA